jgi:O-antigen ligase
MSERGARIDRAAMAGAADPAGSPGAQTAPAERAVPPSPVPPSRTASGVAGLILLAAVAAGVAGQGAFYRPQQRLLGLLVLAAAAVALPTWPLTRREARLLLAPALALGAWALLDSALLDRPLGSAVQVALLLLVVVAVLLVCGRLSPVDRGTVLTGLLVIGLLVAATGWLGILGRIERWAWQGDGIWRAASTLSYPNAAAALLVPLVMVALARLVDAPGSVPLALTGTGLLVGVGATLSRAGVLGLAVAVVVLARLRGPGRVGRAAVGPFLGAVVAVGFLLPSMPAGPARPAPAIVGLAAGLALAAAAARLAGRPLVVTLACLLLAGGGLLTLAVGSPGTLGTVADARVTLASPDRSAATRAALDIVIAHPVTGAGAGAAELRSTTPDGLTRRFAHSHDEYLQVAAELGLVGLVLLVVLLVGLARLVWSGRAAGAEPAAWAAAVAGTAGFAVHSTLDFVWHLPAVLIAVLLVAGAGLPAPARRAEPHPPGDEEVSS